MEVFCGLKKTYHMVKKAIPHEKKRILHGHVVCFASHMAHTKYYSMWFATNHGIPEDTMVAKWDDAMV